MTPELEQKLITKYPKIFVDCGKTPQESCMAWGLEVGDGWYNLIDVLCEALTYTYTTSVEIDEEDGKRLNIKPINFKPEDKPRYFFKVEPPQVVADQVKEKFGELRFYYHLEYSQINVELDNTGKYPELKEINKRYADYIGGVVHFAAIASSHVCEVSGDKGKLSIRGFWYKTLSEETANKEPYLGYKPVDLNKS